MPINSDYHHHGRVSTELSAAAFFRNATEMKQNLEMYNAVEVQLAK